jgi:hypothetical protein
MAEIGDSSFIISPLASRFTPTDQEGKTPDAYRQLLMGVSPKTALA